MRLLLLGVLAHPFFATLLVLGLNEFLNSRLIYVYAVCGYNIFMFYYTNLILKNTNFV